MNKLGETITTIWHATRYSLSFCWRNYKGWTVARLIVTATVTALGYVLVQTTGSVINAVQVRTENGIKEMPWGVISLFIGALLLAYIFSRAHWYVGSNWNHRLRLANKREMQEHKASLDEGTTRSKEFDDLSKRIGNLPYGPETPVQYTRHLIDTFATLTSFLMYGSALLWYKPEYAGFLLLAALPMVVGQFMETTWWWRAWEERTPHNKRRAVLETSYHSKTAFAQALMWNQMPTLRKRLDENYADEVDAYELIRKKAVVMETVVHFISTLGLGCVIAHAIWWTLDTGGAVGTLAVIMAAARTFQGNLQSIADQVAEQWNTAQGVVLIHEKFFTLKPLVQTLNPIDPDFEGAPCIRFDRVSFTYPDTTKIALREVSFTFEPGSKNAIVGRNGHGKSTIQKLLTRMYDPTSGAIYADDINLRNITPRVWNEYVSCLTQEFTVLQRTVEEEIASSMFGIEVDPDRILASAKFARFEEVLESDPLGFQTQIGTEFGGREFSGGESQRLALARVKYRNTPILVLDEPDSDLDPETAQGVMDAIFGLDGVTVILITQHVSRTQRCDKVIVMGKGEIAEQGKPADLLAHGSHYASLFRADQKRLGEIEQIGQ